ncbi:MAG: MmgE/PrpD family protein [Pirellulaceae bacterium]|nr:MmgE/PrpD family protein [Pirellulaceae bacterium]
MPSHYISLPHTSNQARGIGQYAIDFLAGRLGQPGEAALAKVEQFHTDSVGCAIAALATGTAAPRLLRDEAWEYPDPAGATCFGSNVPVAPEKAVVANCAAVRELDANGTNFGYNPRTGNKRGEFGHNDFYPVVVAAAQIADWDGRRTLLAMLCLDEIRGRLAEVFGLKDHRIDHVLHGAIASAAVYGAILGATAEQIESAIGLVVAHYVPFRAIRHGEQLSDSKGASAAISSEVAVLSMRRAMRGFAGPADIFRNPQAVFCLFEPPKKKGTGPFDLELAASGDDFAVMGMHFKLGLYEHQSAGAIAGLFDLLSKYPGLWADPAAIRRLAITIYEPAFSIIGDPHKRDPRTRQSADHSMVYIVATLLRKAVEAEVQGSKFKVSSSNATLNLEPETWNSCCWRSLMLLPADYDDAALHHPLTRELMGRIDFRHGGPEYDAKYPDGIPTSLEIEHATLGTLSSGLVMYPAGHARNTTADLPALLADKFHKLAALGVREPDQVRQRLTNLAAKSPAEIQTLYSFAIDHVRPA